jgi:hypothetical protein
MEPYAAFDRSDFPLVVIRFTGEKSTDENFKAYLDEMSELYRATENVAIVFDAREANLPDLGHQRMQANWLRENKGVLEERCKGTAYVITKVAVRTVLRMIFTLYRQPVPYKVFGNMKEARAWAKNRLQD